MINQGKGKTSTIFGWLTGIVLAGALLTGTAQADVSVHVIQNDPDSGNAGIVPSASLPSADFISPNINFNTGSSDTTPLHTFLNNPTFTNQQNGFNPNAFSDNIFLEITAQTFLNAGANAFVVGHDDGVVLTFPALTPSLVVNAPGPTGFVNTPFNVNNPGAAGLFAFDLKYTECCSGPANLVFTINGAPIGPPASGVPEPSTWILLGTGLAGLVIWRRHAHS
ncbi:MAG TPA: PEP-CTERM sorting domain-containing protein [Nitrospirales bacterium]